MSKSKTLIVAGQAAFFLAGNIFTLFIGFALQIYLAKKLGAEGLGVFGLLESGVAFVTALLSFGLANTAVRYIPEHLNNEDYGKIHCLIQKGMMILAVSGILGLIIVLLLFPLIEGQWLNLLQYKTEVFSVSLLIPLGLLLFFSSQVLRGFLDVKYIVIGSSFIQLSVKALLSVVFIYLGWDVLGYIWAVIVATMTALIWMLIGVRKHLYKIPIHKKEIPKDIFPAWKSYAKVMYANSLLSFWSAPLDRFLLGYFLSSSAVGILIVTKTIYALPAVFLQMFIAIIAPMMAASFAAGNKHEVQSLYHQCTDWLVRISLPLLIFLIVYAKSVLNIFGQDFADQGDVLLQLLLLAQLISLLCGPIGNVLNMCGLEKFMFKISMISVIISALMMVIAIPSWGLIGAGWAIIFAVTFPNLAALYIAKRKLGFKWWDKKYLRWFLPSILTVLFAWSMSDMITGYFELFFMLVFIYVLFHGSQLLIYGLNKEDMEIYTIIKLKIRSSVS